MRGKKIRLEGEQAEQLLPQPRKFFDAFLPPGPDLRRHVMHALDAGTTQRLEHPQAEAGAVDRDHDVGRVGLIAATVSWAAAQQQNSRQDFGEADAASSCIGNCDTSPASAMRAPPMPENSGLAVGRATPPSAARPARRRSSPAIRKMRAISGELDDWRGSDIVVPVAMVQHAAFAPISMAVKSTLVKSSSAASISPAACTPSGGKNR